MFFTFIHCSAATYVMFTKGESGMVNHSCNVFEEFETSSWDHLRQQSSHVNFVTNLKCVQHTYRSLLIRDFFRNAQRWQCWEFCTTSNGNKLEVVSSGLNFIAKYIFVIVL